MRRPVLFFAIAALAPAQTPSPKVEFEVASIRRATEDGHHNNSSDGGLLRIHNFTLKRLIAQAYDVDLRQIVGGPDWLDSESYDIRAKIPAGFAESRREKMPLMMQNLLADRFHLTVHRQPTEISGYALVVAKKGPKMEPSGAGNTNSSTQSQNGHLHAENVTMDTLAKTLSRNPQVGKLVENRTGLNDRFNFELEWDVTNPLAAKGDAAADDRPSIFTALQERLGLKLEPSKIQVQAIVVDHAVKPDEN